MKVAQQVSPKYKTNTCPHNMQLQNQKEDLLLAHHL